MRIGVVRQSPLIELQEGRINTLVLDLVQPDVYPPGGVPPVKQPSWATVILSL